MGERFPTAEREQRPPSVADLWEGTPPYGPYVVTALRARELHARDVTYIVRDGEVKIVSPSTGRVLTDSRWMDDLHQVGLCCAHLGLQGSRRSRSSAPRLGAC